MSYAVCIPTTLPAAVLVLPQVTKQVSINIGKGKGL
jgi:hypothetical protein